MSLPGVFGGCSFSSSVVGIFEPLASTKGWRITKTWVSRTIRCIETTADRLSEAVSSVTGLSALVRVVTSASNAIATISEYLPHGIGSHVRFTQDEFDGLVGASYIFADPEYFLCGDARKDIKKGRFFWVVGSVFSTIVDFGNFVIWLKDVGHDGVWNAFNRLTETRALRWSRVVSATTALGIVSIGAYGLKCTQRIMDLCRGEKPILSVVDGLSQASEAALKICELIPGCGQLTVALLGIVAASFSVASYFTEICLETDDKNPSEVD